jgi:hypothetical protein
LRKVTVAGPPIGPAGASRRLWVLSAGAPGFGAVNALDAHGHKIGKAIDQAHPVRVLATEQPAAQTDNDPPWLAPRLLSMHLLVGAPNSHYAEASAEVPDSISFAWDGEIDTVYANKGRLIRTAGEDGNSALDRSNPAPFVQVVAQPLPVAPMRWPPDEADEKAIMLPPVRLVGGRIGLHVKLNTFGAAGLKWLAKLKIVTDQDDWARIWLVPDGIEFEADLPFPGTAGGLLRGMVRMYAQQEEQKVAFRLELIERDADRQAWRDAWNAITPERGAAGGRLAGLELSANRSGALPKFMWKVAMGPKRPQGIQGGSMYVPPEDFSLSLVSPAIDGSVDGVARLVLPRLKVSDTVPGKVVTFAFETAPPEPQQLCMAFACKQNGLVVSSAGGAKVQFDLDVHRLAADLRAAYGLATPPPVPARRAPGLRYGAGYDRPLIPAFVPLAEGWLQLPVPNLGPLDASSDAVLGRQVAPRAVSNVLNGFFRIKLAGAGAGVQSAYSAAVPPAPAEPPWSMTIERAENCDGTIEVSVAGTDPAKLEYATVKLRQPNLSARGLLWLAADRPDAQEALPRLGAGPGAFIDAAMETPEPGAQSRSVITAEITTLQLEVKTAEPGAAASSLQWDGMALWFQTKATRWAQEMVKPMEALEALFAARQCIDNPGTPPSAPPPTEPQRFNEAGRALDHAGWQLGELDLEREQARMELAELNTNSTLHPHIPRALTALTDADHHAGQLMSKLGEAREKMAPARPLLTSAPAAGPEPWPAVAWLRHPHIPLAAQMPMTRAAAGSVRPLESRDLMPYALRPGSALPTGGAFHLATLVQGRPLCRLAAAGFEKRRVTCWPSPDGAGTDLRPERGVAFAAVGLPGVELRAAASNPGIGSAPVYEAALRFDLPLLDEAFSTASLPPPSDPSADASAAPAPPVTALDWPLLAGFWQEQDRKLQNSRVVDSYLSGFYRTGATTTVPVTTLVRGLTWSADVRVDTPAGALPYGTLALAGGPPSSGNEALAGLSGRFARTASTLAVAPAGKLLVLGFSPATFKEDGPGGAKFDLDNRLSGALPYKEAGQLMQRSVRYPGASANARLVTLLAPLEVSIAGQQFNFWFKDVLFDGNQSLLPPGPALAFDVMDDTAKLVKAGREWRFATDDALAAEITLRLGTNKLPCGGFLLEPLRLTGVSLVGDALQAATIECRLDLASDAGDAEAGGNRIRMTLSAGAPGAPLAATFTALDPLHFTLNAPDSQHRSSRRVTIDATMNAGRPFEVLGTEFTVEVAGVALKLGMPTVTTVPPTVTATLRCERVDFEVTPPASAAAAGQGRMAVRSASVSGGYTLEAPTASKQASYKPLPPGLNLDRVLEIYPDQDHGGTLAPVLRLELDGASPELHLLGCPVTTLEAPVINEGDEVLAISIDGAYQRAGVTVASVALGMLLRLDTSNATPGVALLPGGHVEGSLVQEHGRRLGLFGPSIRLASGRCDFQAWSDEPPGSVRPRWTGSMTVAGTLFARSLIRWPALQTSSDQVPLPHTTPPVSGRVSIGLRANPGLPGLHRVVWTLSGHRLPLALAGAIAAPGSSAQWVTPVLARHRLRRGDQERNWSGVESIALGRPSAIIPPLPPSVTDDTTTFAARYRRKVPYAAHQGLEPGMRRPGLGAIGTVLQGSMGAGLRRLFWEGEAADSDALMIAGGFLGIIRRGSAGPGRLVRLPVLAGAQLELPQNGFGGGTIELAWSDGPAARALALTRPGAPSPANRGYAALSAALLAGSLPMAPLKPDESLGDAVGAMLVEQSFDTRDPAVALAPDAPFFLASAVEVDRLLTPWEDNPALEVLSLFAGVVNRSRNKDAPVAQALALAAAVSVRDIAAGCDTEAVAPLLVLLGDKRSSAPWRGPKIEEADVSLTSMITALALRRDPAPRASMLCQPAPGALTRYLVGEFPSLALDRRGSAPGATAHFADDGRGAPVVPGAQVVPGAADAAETLRWLAAPAEGPITPVRDLDTTSGSGSGLAGLSGTLNLPASAGPLIDLAASGAQAGSLVWLSQTQAPVYLPLRISALEAPPIGWLQAATPRVRLPVDSDIVNALKGANEAAAPGRKLQPFLPDSMSHCAVGERAGIVTLRGARLLTRLDAPAAAKIPAYDANADRFGAPAQAGASFGRTMRTPRPGPLPPNTGDRRSDRRIQAAMVHPTRPFGAFIGSADIVQGETGKIATLDPHGAPVPATVAAWSVTVLAETDRGSTVSDRWDGTIALVCRLELLVESLSSGQHSIPVDDLHTTPLRFLAQTILPLQTDLHPDPDPAGTLVAQSRACIKVDDMAIPLHWLTVGGADARWTAGESDTAMRRVFRADVTLILDPRSTRARASVSAHPALSAALSDPAALPQIELQWTVLPGQPDNGDQAPVMAVGTAYKLKADPGDATLVGGRDNPPLTLRMALYPISQARGTMPLTPASLVFSDPAYDRDLAGPPARSAMLLKTVTPPAPAPAPNPATPLPNGRGGLMFELAADRPSVNLRGVVTFMLDIRYERPLTEIEQAVAEVNQVTASGGDLTQFDVPAALALRIESADGKARDVKLRDSMQQFKLGSVYELPLAMLVETDGSPARLRAGDMLVMEASLAAGPISVMVWDATLRQGVPVVLAAEPRPVRTLRIMLTSTAVIEPPPALYAALLRTPAADPGQDLERHTLALALHAQSPLPRRVMLLEPARGFRQGMMKRHADFIWTLCRPLADFEKKNSLYVLKSDRNGQGYWPDTEDSFLMPEKLIPVRPDQRPPLLPAQFTRGGTRLYEPKEDQMTCELFNDDLPTGLQQLSSGVVTADNASVRLIGTGGQAAYVELVNGTVHATPMTVRFYTEGPTGETDLCSSSMLMTPVPMTKIVFKHTVFGASITWRVEVALGADVEVATVTCTLLSI